MSSPWDARSLSCRRSNSDCFYGMSMAGWINKSILFCSVEEGRRQREEVDELEKNSVVL